MIFVHNMKKHLNISIALGLLSLSACSYPSKTTPLTGADRDEYGCIPSAGYTWDEKESRCVRPWELSQEKE
jgi:hypothetical protein